MKNKLLLSVIATIASTTLFAMENSAKPKNLIMRDPMQPEAIPCPGAYTRNYFLPKKTIRGPQATNNMPTKKTLAQLKKRFDDQKQIVDNNNLD